MGQYTRNFIIKWPIQLRPSSQTYETVPKRDGSVRADLSKALAWRSLTRNDPPCQRYVTFGRFLSGIRFTFEIKFYSSLARIPRPFGVL
jgi:hypothetical protein